MPDPRWRQPDETQAECNSRNQSKTGRMIWMDASESGCFESRAIPETFWMSAAAVGEQSGTYYRSVRTHDGMTVWNWGGRDAETLHTLYPALYPKPTVLSSTSTEEGP